MKKTVRQTKIEQLINQYVILTQEELMERLRQAAINATKQRYPGIFVKCVS